MTLGTAAWIAAGVYVGWVFARDARKVYSAWRDAQREIERARRDAAGGRVSADA